MSVDGPHRLRESSAADDAEPRPSAWLAATVLGTITAIIIDVRLVFSDRYSYPVALDIFARSAWY